MNNVATKILETQTVTDENGKVYSLHSHTSLEQCEFIQNIITEINAKTTLEVGLAYGISTLFICEAVAKQDGNCHYVIDPQQDGWNNIGLKNLKEAGYERLVDFRRDYSHNVLPELYRSGVKLDFAYVDTTKIFDVVLIDAYYIFSMLRIGGVVMFDDCSFPSLRKLARLLATHPSLRVYDSYALESESWQVRMLSQLCNIVPNKEKIFAPNLLKLDSKLGVNAHCIAFQKVSEDSRNWDWFKDF
jgi:predicted O-methyltransferase YrrM